MTLARRLFKPSIAALVVATFASMLAPSAAPAADAPAASTAPIPAADYTLDKAHSTLLFKVNHLGFSYFTARFASFDAQLHFEPKRRAASRIDVTIDAASLQSDNAPAGFLESLRGPDWLDAAAHPTITFRSTRVSGWATSSMQVTGDFTLHGVTKPITLTVVFNGGYASHPMDPNARIGFSARGRFKRSDFGIAAGVPAPGTQMGVGDQVEVTIECEFTGPPTAAST